jgi:hypothetical protein
MNYNLTYKHKKQLEKDIGSLSHNEYNEILNIIRNNKQKYSENIGGIYFNLKYINNNTIYKIIEFVRFAKANRELISKKKDTNNNQNKTEEIIINKLNRNIGKKYTLDKLSIQQELLRLKNKNMEKFSFQNFLDKLSVSNIKTFKKNDKMLYPELKELKMNFSGSSERILKKCREVNKRDFYSYFSYNDGDNEEDNKSEYKTIQKCTNNKYEKELKNILEIDFI